MGIIKDKKKFERTVEQKNPTNLKAGESQKTNEFDIDKNTIKKQQTKK